MLVPTFNLASIFATHENARFRNGPRAVALARRASQRTHDSPEAVNLLGAAYAETGQFQDAIKAATRAQELAKKQHKIRLAAAIGERLKLYESHEPYHLTERTNRVSAQATDHLFGLVAPGVSLQDQTKLAQERHLGRLNMAFCDGHIRDFKIEELFFGKSDESFQRWNRDHEPHRERFDKP